MRTPLDIRGSLRASWATLVSCILMLILHTFTLSAAQSRPSSQELTSQSSGQSQTLASANTDKDATTGDIKSADASTQNAPIQVQVFLPPVLEKNTTFWGSIYDSDGSILAEQKVLINDVEYESNEYGSFSYKVPSVDSLSIAVLDQNRSKIWEAKYTATAHGLLVSDSSSAAMVDNLDELSSHGGTEPIISHAPSLLEATQTFVIVGRNFSGKQGDNDVEIDGRNADILAASPRSLVAVSGKFIGIGPLKELRVANRTASSLPTELDIAKVDLRLETENGKTKLRVSVLGTNLPASIALVNQALKANLRYGNWRLGKQNIFLSPGGQRNLFEVDPDHSVTVENITAHLISNGLFDPYSLKTTRALLGKAVADTEERAEAIRLKRREIGLEAQQIQINQELQNLQKTTRANSVDESKIDDSSKSIAARLFRVQKMLQARRAVIESDSAGDFAKLMDAAANNTVASLDAVLATKDLGFTEARLFKVSARRAAEEQAQNSSMMYAPQYTSTPTAFLQTYRKKHGKATLIPPPPQTATLLPPPAPYRPGPDDLPPFLIDPHAPAEMRKNVPLGSSIKQRKKREETGGKSNRSKRKSKARGANQIVPDAPNVSAVKTSHLHKQSSKAHSHKVS